MVFRFEHFELDPDQCVLRGRDGSVEMEPQVFDLLLYLVEHRDRVISKDELFREIWDGRIVSDSALASRINAARKAVDDNGVQQRLIQTSRKRGFRFVGEVTTSELGPASLDAEAAAAAGDARSEANAQSVADATQSRPVLAVLPFKNLSNDPEQEFFSDGIAEDITAALSRFRFFFVIASNSSFTFKGDESATRRLADELGVQYVVEGSVRTAGNRMRITAQLSDAHTREQIWSDRYDRDVDDLFAVQDEITTSVANSVAPELLSAEMGRALRQVTPMIDTWSRVMRARELVTHFDKENSERARALLEEAIAADPRSSLAHADFAFAHFISMVFAWSDDLATAVELIKSSANKAVELDGRDPWARCVHGISKLYGTADHDAALRELKAALEINPNLAFAHMAYGWISALAGEVAQIADHCELAIRHSPRDPFVSIFWAGYGFACVARDDLAKAIECGQRSIECVPPFVGGYRILAAALAMAGRVEEAKEAAAELMRRAPVLTLEIVKRQQPWKLKERETAFIDALRMAGIPDG